MAQNWTGWGRAATTSSGRRPRGGEAAWGQSRGDPAVPAKAAVDVHCAQVLAHSKCALDGLPIRPDKSYRQHQCTGECGNYLHGICGEPEVMGDDGNENQRICFGCRPPALPRRARAAAAATAAEGRKRKRVQRPPVTVDSEIVPDPRVSPGRRAAQAQAAQNLQNQGKRMQRRAAQAQGGYLNLPLGLVVRHRISQHDRAKCDTPTMLAVVVKQPGATVYTIATKGGVLEQNIGKTYLTVPTPELSPSSVGLDGVLEDFDSGKLKKRLTIRQFAATNSMVGGPGILRCGCKKGDCSSCKCAKEGRLCHSGCACAKHGNCANKE